MHPATAAPLQRAAPPAAGFAVPTRRRLGSPVCHAAARLRRSEEDVALEAIRHALKALRKRHLAEEAAHAPAITALSRPFAYQMMEQHAEPLAKEQAIHESGARAKKIELVYRRKKFRGKPITETKEKSDLLGLQASIADHVEYNATSESGISLFDTSVEKHFATMEKISMLCGEEEPGPSDEDDVGSISDTVTFLSEWRYFNYKPRTVRFASEVATVQDKDFSEFNLPQFSSVAVPVAESSSVEADSTPSRNDFIFYAGGSVWALDWCPRPDLKPDSLITHEFIAVSAHPPDSAYHKLGARLSGRGMIQIWCLLNYREKEEDALSLFSKPCKKSQKAKVEKKDDGQPEKPRGRPKKHPNPTNLDFEIQPVEVLALDYPENNSNIAATAKEDYDKPRRPRRERKKKLIQTVLDNMFCEDQAVEVQAIECSGNGSNIASTAEEDDAQPRRPRRQRKKQSMETELDNLPCMSEDAEVLAIEYPQSDSDSDYVGENPVSNSDSDYVDENLVSDSEPVSAPRKRKWKAGARSSKSDGHVNSTAGTKDKGSEKYREVPTSHVGHDDFRSNFAGSSSVPKDILPPRVAVCLGHNGKVAWDVKWRPHSSSSNWKQRLGYLAGVLGDGSLEVWEIPSPRVLKVIFLSRKQDRTDPRFVKLKPVFRCSVLRCGGRQSIPLTLEWSRSPPHDLILAGCHDGVVALWKFSPSTLSTDSRPLLCFSADTVPIRALAWAPSEGDPESSNVIVTAGHEGMKFWDLRDPHRTIWDISAQRFIYSLDWHTDPRCVLTSYDDGTLRILGISKAAYDVPATGKPFAGTQQQGLHSYVCSSFAIWSVQVSHLTGMVAYCGSDGTVLYFQLTSKAVDKDPTRNRAPHFLCGAMTDEDGVLVINTPTTNVPYPMRRSTNEWGNTPRSLRGFVSDSNRSQSKGAKVGPAVKKPDNQPIALAYDDDDDDDMNQPLSTLKKSKSKTGAAKKPKENQGSASNKKAAESMNEKPDANPETEAESFPSKLVAMHKVRWNLNKGSERWLCYGGSSGVVRCQKIMPPAFDKKRLKK